MGGVPGVSVVVCTHNGAARLPDTLAHLAAQQVRTLLTWEVVVVDNGSTDDTAAVARSAWPVHAPAPLRIVAEPTLGLRFARVRAFAEARHTLVSFVDDDNWVAPDWVETVWQVMEAHPEAGACGGDSEAAIQGTPPAWFERHAALLAVGRQGETAGAAAAPGFFWGAGLTVWAAAWEALRAEGFELSLLGPRGAVYAAGDDVELCYAIGLGGWRLWYDPRLRLRHFIRASRLHWTHLRHRCYGWGEVSVSLDPYLMAAGTGGLRGPLLRSWSWRLVVAVGRVLWHGVRAVTDPGEGSQAVLHFDMSRGRLRSVLGARPAWHANRRRVRDAAWRRPAGASLSAGSAASR